jgi:hypothetical protein
VSCHVPAPRPPGGLLRQQHVGVEGVSLHCFCLLRCFHWHPNTSCLLQIYFK